MAGRVNGSLLAGRSVIDHATEVLASGPRSSVDTNVHAGLRVAVGSGDGVDGGDEGDEGIVGWDLPRSDSVADVTAGADVPALPPVYARLDAAATAPGSVTWSTALQDECTDFPAAAEELAWRDVDVARAGGVTYAIARHDELADGLLGRLGLVGLPAENLEVPQPREQGHEQREDDRLHDDEPQAALLPGTGTNPRHASLALGRAAAVGRAVTAGGSGRDHQ
jgi:hypothetical protein